MTIGLIFAAFIALKPFTWIQTPARVSICGHDESYMLLSKSQYESLTNAATYYRKETGRLGAIVNSNSVTRTMQHGRQTGIYTITNAYDMTIRTYEVYEDGYEHLFHQKPIPNVWRTIPTRAHGIIKRRKRRKDEYR